jgi:predicted GIY-YIG superfamily endonuclease
MAHLVYMLSDKNRTRLTVRCTPEKVFHGRRRRKHRAPLLEHLIYLEFYDNAQDARHRALQLSKARKSAQWKLVSKANPRLREMTVVA